MPRLWSRTDSILPPDRRARVAFTLMWPRIVIGTMMLLGSPVATAHAGEVEHRRERLPLSFVARPLTLPRMILSPGLQIEASHDALSDTPTAWRGAISAVFGMSDDLTLRATLLPLELSPSFDYGNPSFGATYRFYGNDRVEFGAQVDAVVRRSDRAGDPLGWFVRPGLPILFRMSPTFRLDTGVFLPIAHANEQGAPPVPGVSGLPSKTKVGVEVPIRLVIDPSEQVHIGASTAFLVRDAGDFERTFAIPLGIFAGYAVRGSDGPILEIDPFFQWPGLVTPAFTEGDKVHARTYTVGVAVLGFLYL
jgi:hypothetical protein